MNLKKVLNYIFGISLLSMGVILITHTNKGASPWDLLSLFLSKKTNLKIGTWSFMNQAIVSLLLQFLFKQNKAFLALIPAILQGLIMNFFQSFSYYLPNLNYFIYLTLGSLLIAIGFLLYTSQGILANAIDQFTLTMKNTLSIKDSTSKLITDFIPLSILFLFGQRPHMSTMYVYLMVPLFINLTQISINKVTNYL